MIWPSELAPHLKVLGDYWKHFMNDNLSVHTVKGEHDSWLDVSVFELGHLLAERISSAAGTQLLNRPADESVRQE